MAALLPLSAFLSFSAAFFAVSVPQQIALARGQQAQRAPFSFWAVKFSLTILLLALSLRVLHEGGWLAAPYYIAGAAAAVLFNIALLLRLARQPSEGGAR